MSGRPEPDWQEPNEVHLTRIDVPFLDLTWFFVKASMALAVAFLVTSWLWVVIGTGVVALSSGLLLLLGVPGWFAPSPSAVAGPASVAASVDPPMLVAPAPAPEPEVVVPEPPALVEPPAAEAVPSAPAAGPTSAPQVDPNAAATEAIQRAELERLRRERQR